MFDICTFIYGVHVVFKNNLILFHENQIIGYLFGIDLFTANLSLLKKLNLNLKG